MNAPALAPCARCASPLEPGDLRCAVCGAGAPESARRARESVVAVVLRCPSCSAALRYDAAASAPLCAFCGEATRREEVHDPLEQTRGYLPFRVSRAAAQEALSKWLGGLGFFRPSDLRSASRLESVQPTWWVAWAFDARALVSWAADSNAGAGRSAWAPHAGRTTLVFDDILVSASRGLTDEETRALAGSYELASARPEPDGAEGAAIEEFDAQRSQARARILAAIERLAVARVEAECVPGSRARNVRVAALLSGLETRRLAFPAWILAYRYRDKLYRAVVSGQDARCLLGKAPWSVAKIAAVVALGTAALLGVLLAILLAS